MNELMVKDDIKVENMIYEIRGVQVMLDSDLAKIYQVETKRINEAVKNNADKFPERFSWKLTDKESSCLLVESFDQKKIDKRGGKYKNPRVFTEQGIYMLATILKSKIAKQMTLVIMDTFVSMKKYISSSFIEQKYINELALKDSKRIDILEETLSNFKEKNHHIFFEGQIYDAYSLMMSIFEKSKDNITIIDNYIDRKILDIISQTNKKIKVITTHKSYTDVEKFLKQYNNLEIVTNNSFHDRFILIDGECLYHCGASFKDLGYKCFAITKIDDKEMLNNFKNRIR